MVQDSEVMRVYIREYHCELRRASATYVVEVRKNSFQFAGLRTTDSYAKAFRVLLYATRRALRGQRPLPMNPNHPTWLNN